MQLSYNSTYTFHTWSDDDIILSEIHAAAMLEVYYVAAV